MALPSKVKPGDPIKASDWNALLDFVRAIQMLPSSGVRVTRSGGGTTLALSIPKGGRSSAVETWPFMGCVSQFRGTGNPPPDQAFRVKSTPGIVNQFSPSNMNAEFVCAAGTAPTDPPDPNNPYDDGSKITNVWVHTSHDVTGAVTAVELRSGDSIPVEPAAGDDGTPPSDSYQGIFQVRCDQNGVLGIDPLVKSSLRVVPVVTDIGCGTITKAYQWTLGTY